MTGTDSQNSGMNRAAIAVGIVFFLAALVTALMWNGATDDVGLEGRDANQESAPNISRRPRQDEGALPAQDSPESGVQKSQSTPQSNTQHSAGYERSFHLRFVPTTDDASRLVATHIRLQRKPFENEVPKRNAPETINFDISGNGEVSGKLPLSGNYMGEIVFEGTRHRHKFPLNGIGFRRPSGIRPIKYAYCKSIKWPYECLAAIESAVLRTGIEEDEEGIALSSNSNFLVLDREISLPKYLTVTVRDGRKWRKRIAEEPGILNIDFGETISIYAVDLLTGKPLLAARSQYNFKDAVIFSLSTENGECFVPSNSIFSVVAPGYLQSKGKSDNLDPTMEPPLVPLIHVATSALRFLNEEGDPLKEMRVMFGWKEDPESLTDPSGNDPRVRGQTDETGVVRWQENSLLDLHEFDGVEDASNRNISLFLRDKDWRIIWQSEDPLILQDLVAQKDIRIKVAPQLLLRVKRNSTAEGVDLVVKGLGLMDSDIKGRLLHPLGKKTDDPNVFDFGHFSPKAIEVSVEAKGFYPTRQVFTDLKKRVIEITLEPVQKLMIQVRDKDGEGVDGIAFHVNDLNDGSRRHPSGHASTDEFGRAEFSFPLGRSFLVHAQPADGQKIDLWPPQVIVEGGKSLKIEFTALERRLVKIVAKSESGEEYAKPFLTNPYFAKRDLNDYRAMWWKRELFGWTRTPGFFALPEDFDLETIVVAPRSRPKLMIIRIGASQEQLNISLPSGPSLEGQLVDDEGEPRKGVKVHVSVISLDGLAKSSDRFFSPWHEATHSNQMGQFRFNALTPGKYRLDFRDAAGQVLRNQVVVIEQDLILPPITLRQ
ncbi:MAG: hypothetical protein ACI97A_002826 [Planctomycetota bacterium]|jgi:hypothetical protein